MFLVSIKGTPDCYVVGPAAKKALWIRLMKNFVLPPPEVASDEEVEPLPLGVHQLVAIKQFSGAVAGEVIIIIIITTTEHSPVN